MDFTVTLVIQLAINGLLIGGIYSLCAIGLNLIMGVMKVINFAQGDFIMVGMYVSYWLFTLYGVDPYISVLASFPFLFVTGMIIQRVLVLPTLKSSSSAVQLLMTFGVSMIIQNMALLLYSTNFRLTNATYSGLVFRGLGLQVSFPRLVAFISALIFTVALYAFLKKSRLGMAVRATTQNEEAATLMGININYVRIFAFGLAAALAGAAGSLVTPYFYVFPSVGSRFVLMGLVIVVLGGLGSFEGAFFGGLIMGIVESFASFYLSAGLKDVVSLCIFVLLLLVKPSGLFGSRK